MLLWQKKIKNIISLTQKKIGNEQSMIGIDVGSSSIKVVQMAHVDGELSIVKLALVPIGGVPGRQEEILASLETALIGFETKGAKVVAVVNCPQTCTRKIVTPQMPKKELNEAIRWEAKNAISFSIEEALLDFEVLGEVLEKGIKKIVVAIGATPKETANQLLSLFSKAGIEISSMIPISGSLSNLIALSKEKQQLNIAMIEMGASITELDIYQKGRLAFSRKLPIAGNDITKSMTSTLMSGQGKVELSIEEAEKIKKEHGIPSGESTEPINGKILPNQILSLIRPCVEQLVNEIERSFDFFREESYGQKVDKIILFGGSASLKGLVAALHKELGINIEVGNSLEGIHIGSKISEQGEGDKSRFNLAVGAALYDRDKINLLPLEIKEKSKRFFENVSLEAAAVGVVMIMLLSYIGLNIQFEAQHKKLNALTLEQKTLTPQLESMRSVVVANQILKSHPSWEDVLREISNTIEPRMHLTELSMDDDVLNLQGIIIKSDQGTQAVLSKFMVTLEEGIFRHVSLITSKKETEDATISEFEITAEID